MPLMQVSDTRRANLQALIAQHQSVVALAGLVDTDPSYISQITGGHREMGSRFARKVETKLKLPQGWMDSERRPEAPPVAPMDRGERELLEMWRKLPPLIQGNFKALMRQAAMPLSESYTKYEQDQQRRNRAHASLKKRKVRQK